MRNETREALQACAATYEMNGMSETAAEIRALAAGSAAQEPEWIKSLRRQVWLSKMMHNFTFTRDEVMTLLSMSPAAPLPREAATANSQAEYDKHAYIDRVDIDNHNLRRAMQKLMAYLVPILDEDQFASCESIVNSVGILPPDNSPQATATVALTAQQSNAIDAVCAKLAPTQVVDLGDHIEALRSIQWNAAPQTAAPSADAQDERAACEAELEKSPWTRQTEARNAFRDGWAAGREYKP